MISDNEYNKKIKLPLQLKKCVILCNKCKRVIYYYKELLEKEKKYSVVFCSECKHKNVFL